MATWLARFLTRPGIEDVLDHARMPANPPAYSTDFWDGSAIRDFLGPADKTMPFIDITGALPGATRLIFALAADGFNPFQAKAGKGSTTSTGIYMICLNLPPHLRYLPENTYFVIISGSPSKEQINHFLSLVVDDLLVTSTCWTFIGDIPLFLQLLQNSFG